MMMRLAAGGCHPAAVVTACDEAFFFPPFLFPKMLSHLWCDGETRMMRLRYILALTDFGLCQGNKLFLLQLIFLAN